MAPHPLLLAALFLLVASVYASVGFAGGSSYLALLVLFGMPVEQIAPIALLCNTVVALTGSWGYFRAGHLKRSLVLPFLVTSLPAAYLGGRWRVDSPTLRLGTALCLGLAALTMLINVRRDDGVDADALPARALWTAGPGTGTALGFVAGLIGIGGGIFLSPLLHLLRWGRARQIAAVASFFILCNSVSGLVGQAARWHGLPFAPRYALLFVAVLVGGFVGSRFGILSLSALWMRRITGAVVLAAAIRLLPW